MSDHIIYQAQEKELFNTLLDGYLLPKLEDNRYFLNELGMELIVRPECNQTCEYCYLYRHGKDLYPTRKNKADTLTNINLIFDYVFQQRKNYFYDIELFAGDLFYDEIYFDIIDLLDKYFKIIKLAQPEIFDKETIIACPSNLSWVYNQPHLIERFRKIHQIFKQKYNVRLIFSWSTDGLHAQDTREKKILTDEYYNTIFAFCKEFECGYHPMIAPENIKNWRQNYDWWLKKYQEFNLTCPGYFQPYLLEVRNDNWTPELMTDFNHFVSHLMQRRYEMCGKDLKQLGLHLFFGDGRDDSLAHSLGADPLILQDIRHTEGMGCSGQTLVHFNATNLSIVQCHRTSYTQFTPVYFISDEDKKHIIDFQTNNVGSYITWRFHKVEHLPGCATCAYSPLCKKGCPGAQFEKSGELYMPIASVCEFFKRKYHFLYELYEQWGLLDLAKSEGWWDSLMGWPLLEEIVKGGVTHD